MLNHVEEWRRACGDESLDGDQAVRTLAIIARRLGVSDETVLNASGCAWVALRSVIVECAQGEAVKQRIREAETSLEGLYVAEDVARGEDERAHEGDADWEFSDETLAIMRQRQEAEWLVRAGQFLAEYGEVSA